MISSIAIKFIGSITTAAAIVGGGIFLYQEKFSHSLQELSSAIIVSSDDAISVSSDSKASSSIGDYRCKIFGVAESVSECKIFSYSFSNAIKKQSNIDKIVAEESTNKDSENITKANLVDSKKVFKIFSTVDFLNKYEKNKDKKLEIVNSSDNSVIASLNVLFAIKKDKTVIAGRTKTLVGKAKTYTVVSGSSETSVTGVDSSKVFKCNIGAAADLDSAKPCKFYDFATSETAAENSTLNSLDFSKGSTEQKTITQNKHYVVEFTESSDFVDLTTFESSHKLFLHVTTSNAYVSSGTKTVEFSETAPSILSPDDDKNIWILNK